MRGFDQETRLVNAGDTAKLKVYAYDDADTAIPQSGLTSVSFSIQAPDETITTGIGGTIQSDGAAALNYATTTEIGHYTVLAKFTLTDGTIQSQRAPFEVIDPFDPPLPTATQVATEMVWDRLSDVFDSEEGGPWLRDMTLDSFSKDKVPVFFDDALFDINVTHPATTFGLGDFMVATPDGSYPQAPLFVQATFVQVVRHLIRSYAEQPSPDGGQIAWQNRRDYLTRWQTVLTIEQALYDHWVKLYKRRYLMLGHSATLIANKAGRLIPARMRGWQAGRGFY